MKKELIKFNQVQHDSELNYANKDLSSYNKLLKSIQPLANTIGLVIDKKVFSALLQNPKEYAFDTIIGDNTLTIGGVLVTKTKAMDLIEMPDEWVKIIKLVDDFNNELIKNPVHVIPHGNPSNVKRVGLECFEILNDDFVLDGEYVEQLKNTHSSFTENEVHNTALKHINTLNNCFIELHKLGCSVHSDSKLSDFGLYRTQDSIGFRFNASAVIDGIKHREWFAGLSDADRAKYNKYGYVSKFN
ncbi:hypothetical protein [Mucilaginibacter sp.]